MTASSESKQNTAHASALTTPDAKATSEAVLITGAKRWIGEALDAWTEGDQAKVAVMAPMAVELLGKATLWRENPVLLVQLTDQHEASLFLLATQPDLMAKGIKTIGLQVVINRLVKLLGDLPVAKDRQKRIADVRNGAIHVGATGELRYVLLDCLSVLGVLLERLSIERKDFFGLHIYTVDALLDEHRTEISRQVAVKMATARARLTRLEEALGEAAFDMACGELEGQRRTLDPDDFFPSGGVVDCVCPECGSKARLFGDVDVARDSDYEVEALGNGEYDGVVVSYWRASLGPRVFFCMVCNLQLHGTQELAEAALPSRYFEVSSEQLGPDFDIDEHARALYAHE
ncbi:hypothetical protein JOF56_005724 [Kibdelosporangium banguiense]|uniref:DUF4145 domain-containing protein n=1 Tax=Kibdelosporangium banguiense TaxID=1365924 RepID=A0ABS4TLP1_9PSEU|nr:hypothetical protein [Kibdelosporangium banguiense]MBP2325339.1 hypothetical protein [Kibdelosporangium banguiense]